MTSYTIEMYEEYNKCKEDIVYFADKYIHHTTINGIKKLELYPYQIELLSNDRLTANTSRQIGFSVLSYIKIVHSLIFNYDKTIIYYSPSRDRASYSVKNILEFMTLCSFPEIMKPKFITKNKNELSFSNGNQVFGASNINHMIGISIAELYIEDLDFIKDGIDTFIHQGLSPILCNYMTKAWVWTTPANRNMNVLREYLKYNQTFSHYELPWFVIPNRTIQWKESKIDVIGTTNFDYEFLNKCKVSNG